MNSEYILEIKLNVLPEGRGIEDDSLVLMRAGG